MGCIENNTPKNIAVFASRQYSKKFISVQNFRMTSYSYKFYKKGLIEARKMVHQNFSAQDPAPKLFF